MLISKILPFTYTSIFALPKFFLRKKVMIVSGIIIFVILLGYFIYKASIISVSSQNIASPVNQKVQIPAAYATAAINKEFSFAIKDASGKEFGKIKYLLENAELRNEIIVKGQKATAVKGRVFLILNIKLINEANKGVELKTRDFVRISSNNGQEWLAPDIHNDPVEIQAISTKYSRIGLPINETDKSFKVQVGEINGQKQVFDLNF